MKRVASILDSPAMHWVGDGFPVKTLFSYDRLGRHLTPFLLLDYAGPWRFEPASHPRGVGEHPHRGFETVTIVYEGEVAHRDSAGHGGSIGPGDVQWMTAAGGLMHEEFHSERFTREGGQFEVAQLWVNLPAQHKEDAPRYQSLLADEIPSLTLPDGGGALRVIAGQYEGVNGPAQTCTALNVWDLRLKAGGAVTLPLPEGWTAVIALLRGAVRLAGGEELKGTQLALLEREGQGASLEASADSLLLVLSGEPIDEPIAGYGPFVMNTREQIERAFADLQNGRFGQLA